MFAQTYMSNIDQSNTTEALQSIIDCLKTEHKDLSKIRVDLSANVQNVQKSCGTGMTKLDCHIDKL